MKGLVGYFNNGNMKDIFVYNTKVEGSADIGGIVGYVGNSLLDTVMNYGFPNNPNQIIASSPGDNNGGIAATISSVNITRSGVVSGIVEGRYNVIS